MTIQLSDQALLKTQAYINGQWQDADSGETVAVSNPATGEVIAEVAKCGTAETRRAMQLVRGAGFKVHAHWMANLLGSDPAADLLKLAVVNRYQNAEPGLAFIKNFGLKRGAIASTVAHDSHNIIAVGTSDAMLAKAVGARMDVHALDLDRPTADFTKAPAMSEDDCLAALRAGWSAVDPEADLLVKLVEAERVRLKNEALKGIGSERMVGLKMADAYKGLDVIILPSDGPDGVNPLNLGNALQLFDVRKGGRK